jgi:hypothetical protein
MKSSFPDTKAKASPIRIDHLVQDFNLSRRRRLAPRTSYPKLVVVSLHRSLLSRLAGFFGFGD